MDDFYKKIKGAVEGIPEQGPTDTNWKSFDTYRGKRNNPQTTSFPWLMAGAIGVIALLLGSNIYWVNHSMTRANSLLSSTIHDTVYVTRVVENVELEKREIELQTTIRNIEAQLAANGQQAAEDRSSYRALQRRYAMQESELASLQKQFASRGGQFFKDASTVQQKQQNRWASSTALSADYSESTASLTGKNIDRSTLAFSALPSRSLVGVEYVPPKVIHPADIIWIRNDRPFNLLEAITPKSLSIGISGGGQAQFGGQIHEQGGSVGNVTLFTSFSRRLRGYAGLSLYKRHSELEDNPAYPNIPEVEVPEGQEVKETKVASTTIRVQAGFEYMLVTGTQWRPYFGLGYAQSLSNRDKFSFEVEGPQEEYYINPEGAVDQALWRQLAFTLGTDFNLSKGIDLRSAFTFQQGLTSMTPSTFGVFGGLYYHF